jgi:hypothetical protein
MGRGDPIVASRLTNADRRISAPTGDMRKWGPAVLPRLGWPGLNLIEAFAVGGTLRRERPLADCFHHGWVDSSRDSPLPGGKTPMPLWGAPGLTSQSRGR